MCATGSRTAPSVSSTPLPLEFVGKVGHAGCQAGKGHDGTAFGQRLGRARGLSNWGGFGGAAFGQR